MALSAGRRTVRPGRGTSRSRSSPRSRRRDALDLLDAAGTTASYNGMRGTRWIARKFMLFEAATFAVAALTHFGLLVDGYEHQHAGIAETVIAIVLVAGLGLSWALPARTRQAGVAAQGFALARNARRRVHHRRWGRSAYGA